METNVISRTKSKRPSRPCELNKLDRPSEHLAERGNYQGHVAETSLYTKSSLHPIATVALVVGAGLALTAIVRASQGSAK